MELVGGEERVDGENCRLLEGREGPCRVLGLGINRCQQRTGDCSCRSRRRSSAGGGCESAHDDAVQKPWNLHPCKSTLLPKAHLRSAPDLPETTTTPPTTENSTTAAATTTTTPHRSCCGTRRAV
ncbi:hypothetical protein glysoja_037845 [Glycine soja]|uniref:Uncharacterized protein n=1 Tax=Glycine soja TaxID=3848 RepID=A0A0B2Q8T1_GLYSO|nr:hypothetical protein glysoja_037845 [Glycine soja]